MAQTIGHPAGGHLEREHAEVARGQHRRYQRGREAALVHEPDEIEAVHHALERGDVIRQVELEVTAEAINWEA